MKRFNESTPDSAEVRYRSYSSSRPVSELPWSVRDLGHVIQKAEGANDVQVSVASAIWGDHVRTLHADHFEVLSQNFWLNPLQQRATFDHLALYHEIGDWIEERPG